MTLELAVLGPVLLLVIFAVVQAALYFHARSLALAAATEGANAARAHGATPGAGTARAHDFLDRAARGTLTQITVTERDPGPERVRVHVTGTVLSVLPLLPDLHVDQAAQVDREHLTTPTARP